MAVKHRFASAIADSADVALVRPSNWNDTHALEIEGIVPGIRRGTVADRYYVAGMTGGGALAAGVAWVTNTQRAFPFIPARDCTLNAVLIDVSTAGTAGRMGIYEDDGNCHPGNLLSESSTGQLSLTPAAVKTFVFNQALVGGTLYWISLNLTGTPVLRSVAISDALPILGFAATLGAVAPGNGWQQTRTLAALAAWGTGGSAEVIVNAVVPAFACRVA